MLSGCLKNTDFFRVQSIEILRARLFRFHVIKAFCSFYFHKFLEEFPGFFPFVVADAVIYLWRAIIAMYQYGAFKFRQMLMTEF
jgi:hypothetical protein